MTLDLKAIKARAEAGDPRLVPQLVAEVERLTELADFARLLGPARMVLDRCALNEPGCDDEAAEMAQRIVDLIGHPVTDEPPHALVERDALRSEVERLWDTINRLWYWMPPGPRESIRREEPALAESAIHAHHRLSHEQRMMRP